MAHNYILRVTTGSDYDIAKHQVVPVNEAKPITVDSEHISVDLNVRIQSYRGLPPSSPPTSPYFSLPPHASSKDQYSIAFRFTPKRTISGHDLVFGNDFDHPIRDRLPPGFNYAFKMVKWLVDPGLDGDVYAEKPYLYGWAGSSVNSLHVGGKVSSGLTSRERRGEEQKVDGNGEEEEEEEDVGLVFEEGGDEKGMQHRSEKGIPDTAAGRKKWFLDEGSRGEWEWEEGRSYGCDFFNPYLDFNDFALRLPGFTLPIMKYWDGQGLRPENQKRSHTLRYVLKDKATDTVLFVVLFTLYLKEDVDEEGNLKPGIEGGSDGMVMRNGVLHDGAKEDTEDNDGGKAEGNMETSEADLD
ncbi:hypothetical protein BJ875DRAFT_227877 [Amylocarpus encephaloides]|uniref:Domain of unknown function at the cortex 1 domain-containing protein n=1 Tax=Amylocarpus encephaloides TaxID=45428 RepID=A0A9P7YMS3_9HELO|nr:hypothetical protein BJ875DRAFT_227877 [Amylocarpus encephaloides]